jgi:hypothetical protein
MLNQSGSHGGVAFHPLTRDRWSDFEELFGERSACGGASNALTQKWRSEPQRYEVDSRLRDGARHSGLCRRKTGRLVIGRIPRWFSSS